MLTTIARRQHCYNHHEASHSCAELDNSGSFLSTDTNNFKWVVGVQLNRNILTLQATMTVLKMKKLMKNLWCPKDLQALMTNAFKHVSIHTQTTWIHAFAASSEEDGVIIDGDIMVSNEQAAIYYESGWDGLVESEAWENTKRWGKKIPYSVTASDTKSTEVKGILKNLEDSMKEIEKNTCIKFFKAKCYHYTRLSFTVGKEWAI